MPAEYLIYTVVTVVLVAVVTEVVHMPDRLKHAILGFTLFIAAIYLPVIIIS